MMTTTQIIAKQGWMGALVLLIIFIICVLIGLDICAFVCFVLLVLWLYMFRNPERIPSKTISNADNRIFTSPIDGIVRDIRTSQNEVLIVIETRFFDVGVIRAPCDIKQANITYKSGLNLTFCNQVKRELLNGVMRFETESDGYPHFVMEFYPSFFDSSHLFMGDSLATGERMGFMKSGISHIRISRIKQNDIELKINIGDRLYALDSQIGQFL